ncbi:MAG TPA: hypothetical protein VKQ32_11015 [Polyangia bacterium]|nr:hypothetical protein [Polyangia bacterium]
MIVRAPGFRIRSSLEVAFSADGERLATITRNAVALWDVRARARLWASPILDYPSELAFLSDGVFILKNTAGQFASCRTASAEPIATFTPDSPSEGSNVVVLDGDRIVDGSWQGQISVRGTDLQPRVVWEEQRTMVTQVTRGEAGTAFVIHAKHDHPDFERGADRLLFAAGDDLARLAPLAARWRALGAASLSASGAIVALRVRGSELQTLEVPSGQIVAVGQTSVGGTGEALAWSPDERHVVLVEKGGFSFREAASLREIGWLASPYPAAISFALQGNLIALGDWQAGLVLAWPDMLGSLTPR